MAINTTITMTADVTTVEIPEKCHVDIGATSGTVILQKKINSTFFNSDTTISNGTFKVIDWLRQGDIIKVTGGNAIIQYRSDV